MDGKYPKDLLDLPLWEYFKISCRILKLKILYSREFKVGSLYNPKKVLSSELKMLDSSCHG